MISTNLEDQRDWLDPSYHLTGGIHVENSRYKEVVAHLSAGKEPAHLDIHCNVAPKQVAELQ